MQQSQRLAGKVAIIIGASRGIGRVMALGLAREGARVVVAAKSEAEKARLPGTIYTAAQEIDWVGPMAGQDQEAKQVVCVRDGKAYVLTFVATSGRLANFLKRANLARESFEWLE